MTGPGWASRAIAVIGGLGGLRRRGSPPEQVQERPEPTMAEREGVAETVPPDEIETASDPAAELLVALLLIAAAIAFTAFVVLYVVERNTQLLGLGIGLGLVLAGIASALAGKRVVIAEKTTEEYHDFGDVEEQRDVEGLLTEGKITLTRRRLLFSSLAAVGAALGAAGVVPVASLGPRIGERVYDTPWAAGTRVVDENGDPITVDLLSPGEFVTGFPAGADKEELGSAVIVVRLKESELELPADRAHSAPRGYVAYSKICTHAGCAVSMLRYPIYEPTQPSPGLVCPCHYSTFNPADGGSVLFGPAGRPLPQLPLRVAADGSLEAAGAFYEAVGPSYGGIREYPKGRPL